MHPSRHRTQKIPAGEGLLQEFAQYAAESVLFALGLRTSVKEPSDHGFEASDLENVADAVDTASRETEGKRLSELGNS